MDFLFTKENSPKMPGKRRTNRSTYVGNVMRKPANLPEKRVSVLVMQRANVVALVTVKGRVKRSDVVERLGIKGVTQVLDTLIEDGTIIAEGSRNHRTYRLAREGDF